MSNDKRGVAEQQVKNLLGRAIALHQAGQPAQAEPLYREILRLHPDQPDALHLLGVVLSQRGAAAEGVKLIRRAIERWPDPDYYANLGNALAAMRDYAGAEAAYRAAFRLKPDHAVAHYGLGNLMASQDRYADAQHWFREAIRLDPQRAGSYTNLGRALVATGDYEDAESAFREAIRFSPQPAREHSNLVMLLDYMPSADAERPQRERRTWYERYGRTYFSADPAHHNPPDPDRRLRVGYVSADFRGHSANFAFAPIFQRHDRSAIELFLYSNLPGNMEDAVTAELRAGADQWRSIAQMDDAAVAKRIRDDGIDILVDLSGHTAGHRLLVFARSAAPVQVSWSMTGTGLATMQYLFSDPVCIPVEERPLFAEQIFDLPAAMPYTAPMNVPDIGGSPSGRGHPPTFGCANRVTKLSQGALRLWARLLQETPGSRLLLKDRAFDDSGVRARIADVMAQRSIDQERLVFRGASSHVDHLAAYNDIDVALDPYPYSGGVSTYEALLMGVPVITRRGQTVAQRSTAAILTGIGHPEWIARDEDAYVAIARTLIADRDGLARARNTLREQLRNSPACRIESYTGALEAAYRTMWRRWCSARVT